MITGCISILISGCFSITENKLIDKYANSNISAKFILKSNTSDNKNFYSTITLKNDSDKELKNWKLCLNSCRLFKISKDSRSKVIITKQIGEYFEITGKQTLPPGKELSFNIDGTFFIKKFTDTPSCYFLVEGNGKPIPVKAEADLSCLNKKIPPSKTTMPSRLAKSQENLISLIPYPAEVTLGNGYLNFSDIDSIINCTGDEVFHEAIHTFLEEFTPIINIEISHVHSNTFAESAINILTDIHLKDDQYILEIESNRITLKSSSKGGTLYGLITLFELANANNYKIPCVKINDYPRFKYRGSLLDVARNFKSVKDVKKWIKMAALYKLNVFHIHLTDDEGWRIEIKKYPILTKIGAFRGYYEKLPMLSGSGWKKKGGYYTQSAMKDIINYANRLNITVIPEVDVPGHARALIQSFNNFDGKGNNPLIEKADKSIYLTPQNYTDDVLNPALPQTYVILGNIFKEISEIFSEQTNRKMPFSDYIHVGSDEVPAGAWEKSPECIKLKKKLNLKSVADMQGYFLLKLQKILTKNKTKLAAWDEAATSGKLNKETTLIVSWNGIETGINAAKQGYKVVMTPAGYLYFDLAYNSELTEPGYYWAGFINAKQIYSYIPISKEMSNKVIDNIVGLQGCLWGDTLVHPRLNLREKFTKNYLENPVEYMGFPKMTAFSEVVWSPEKKRNWPDFIRRYEHGKKILDKFNIKYRNKPLMK